jgi:uncharacterized membrane protein (DUF485 family)
MADWEGVSRTPEFERLVARRRRFVVIALLVWVAWFGAFIVCSGVARDFMGSSIYQGFTVGYAWALSIIVLTWVVAWLYVRTSARTLDPLAERATAERGEAFVDRPRPGAPQPAPSEETARR